VNRKKNDFGANNDEQKWSRAKGHWTKAVCGEGAERGGAKIWIGKDRVLSDKGDKLTSDLFASLMRNDRKTKDINLPNIESTTPKELNTKEWERKLQLKAAVGRRWNED
jgi:hypothetical protein